MQVKFILDSSKLVRSTMLAHACPQYLSRQALKSPVTGRKLGWRLDKCRARKKSLGWSDLQERGKTDCMGAKTTPSRNDARRIHIEITVRRCISFQPHESRHADRSLSRTASTNFGWNVRVFGLRCASPNKNSASSHSSAKRGEGEDQLVYLHSTKYIRR